MEEPDLGNPDAHWYSGVYPAKETADLNFLVEIAFDSGWFLWKFGFIVLAWELGAPFPSPLNK